VQFCCPGLFYNSPDLLQTVSMAATDYDSLPIPGETELYRINDFFSVAQLIKNRRLFVPGACSFVDANEGVAALLRTLGVSSGFCAGALGWFKSAADAQRRHRWFKGSHFVSCWTRTRESVAMWGLYSPDHCGVQVATTAKRLWSAAEQHAPVSAEAVLRAAEGDVLITHRTLVPVEYESLVRIHQSIERRRKAIDKIRQLGKVKPLVPNEWTARDIKRNKVYDVAPFALKDSSFSHESEVRVVFRVTCAHEDALRFARKVLTDGTLATPIEARLELALSDLEMKAAEQLLAVPQNAMFIEVSKDFVTEVRIDPRCPPHKRAFMEDFFRGAGVPVKPSECFGYLAEGAELRDPRHRGDTV
jgi:hypothetical protein